MTALQISVMHSSICFHNNVIGCIYFQKYRYFLLTFRIASVKVKLWVYFSSQFTSSKKKQKHCNCTVLTRAENLNIQQWESVIAALRHRGALSACHNLSRCSVWPLLGWHHHPRGIASASWRRTTWSGWFAPVTITRPTALGVEMLKDFLTKLLSMNFLSCFWNGWRTGCLFVSRSNLLCKRLATQRPLKYDSK